jgi:HK97 family phage portal protein
MDLAVTLFGRRLELSTKSAVPIAPASGRGAWYPSVRESFPGAWQQNVTVTAFTAIAYPAVFACITLIASDIGKIRLRLVEQDDDDIWNETDSAAFSPVLRKPNHYQTIIKFVESWITSKLMWGNAYVLKQRDARGVVVALYVLNPAMVTPLVTPAGDIYYQLGRDELTGLLQDGQIAVPAREIIHDPMVCLFHPLIGVSPIYACGLAALQGLNIQNNSTQFFGNASNPGGIITVPGAIDQDKADALKEKWQAGFTGANAGRVALLSAGMEYKPITVNAVDAQLIEQLKWTAETCCSTFHVPPYMIGVGPPPPYANIEPLLQQYYSQCLQSLITSFELSLDEGLGISTPIDGTQYGTEFDIDDLIWMDTATKTAAAKDGIGAGGLSPDEARKKYFGLGPIEGGNTPYLQEQYHSLAALAERDAAGVLIPKPPPAVVAPPDPNAADQTAELVAALHRKTLGLRHAA